jgi:two-component system, chemotaxis family, sensor kinase CheA
MDDLLREFLTETNESLDVVDVELVKFEQDPTDDKILGNIFRLVHTIKGTCGFLGLPRLEGVAHAAETLMGKFRDGAMVTSEAVTVILQAIDRIKGLVAELERLEAEPEGGDDDIIAELEKMSALADAGPAASVPEPTIATGSLVEQTLERPLRPGEVSLDDLERAFRETEVEGADHARGTLIDQTLERPLRPGEVSLDDLERAFRETAVEATPAIAPKAEKSGPAPLAAKAKPEADKAEASDEGGVKNQSIRVNVDTLETLMTMVSELVLTRNQLMEINRRNEESEFKVPLQRLSNVTAELQEGVMKTRMQPIGNAWQKLPRIVRDLAKELGKTIELDMHGAETELDRQVLELIKDPLTHMVRNSADHGLETTEGRRAAGKPETGTIKLSAYHQGGHIIIEIADDGKGLDVQRIKKKAIENGLVSESDAERLSDAQIAKFIFAPGFSTAAKVTNVSGRGVGMDVVKTNIDQIGGTVDLTTVHGKGTTFTIKIPLTLAIVSALIVEAAGDRFAIPQLAVVELVRASARSEHRIEQIKDTPVLRLRNKLLPLITLKGLLGIDDTPPGDDGFVVVTHVGNRVFGIVVDAVFHTEEIVVKPMSSKLRHIPMFSGNTILGDGSVIMIVDPNGIASAFGGAAGEEEADAASDEARGSAAELTAMLLFRAGGATQKAVPLSLVTRLEEIDAAKIESANGRDLVQYRGSLMPLVRVAGHSERKTSGAVPMLVFSDSGRSMGLVVDQIVDIVEERLSIEIGSDVAGVLGTAVIKGKATEIVDVAHYLPLAFEDWLKRKELGKVAQTKRLIFVDDSPFFRNMLTPVLKAAGYDVTVYDGARQALDAMRKAERPVDVIVSDIEMPDMNGYDFCEAVKKETRFAATPVIALSAIANGASVERGRVAGFDDYVAKFDRQGLIAALRDADMTARAA